MVVRMLTKSYNLIGKTDKAMDWTPVSPRLPSLIRSLLHDLGYVPRLLSR
jgi:hypothetical protein